MTHRPRARIAPGAVVDARDDAARIVAEARAEAAAIAERARADGLAAGRAEAAALVVAAEAAAARRRADAERDLVRIAVAAAERILGRALALDPDAVIAIVARVIAEAPPRPALVLRVHPADRDAIANSRPALERALADGAALDIRDDPALTRGGCVLSTDIGDIDGRLEIQLAHIERALAATLGDPA